MVRQRIRKDANREGLSRNERENYDKIKRIVTKNKSPKRMMIFIYVIAILLIIIYIIVPFCFRYSVTVRQFFIFMNYINIPFYKNLSNPKEYGLNCTRVLHVENNEENGNVIRLGIWHVLPQNGRYDHCDKMDDASAFDDKRPIFLYFHGNGGARGGDHRIQLYNVLSLNAHVITMDYRGYGDSSNVRPSADGITSDADAVYHWLIRQKHVNPKRVIIWGHSLGTAVSVRFISRLSSEESPKGVVLEAPFTRIKDVVSLHPVSIVHRYMPFFQWFFVEPLTDSVTNFDSTVHIGKVNSPILILHANDDMIVPIYIGQRLYDIALKERSKTNKKTQMEVFDADYGYGHKYICKNPKLTKIVENFITSL